MIFSAPPAPTSRSMLSETNQNAAWPKLSAREQNRPGIQTDSMAKETGKMSSEQDKDLVDKKKIYLHVVLLDLITHIIHIYIYICHMSVLETCYNILGKV